jgi:hypothetical protein
VALALAATVLISSAGANGAAPISVINGKTIGHVNSVTETTAQTTSSTSFVDLPGATTSIGVPAGERALILVRFSGESACTQTGAGSNWCSVRILVDTTEANPAAGLDFAFDSTNGGNETTGSWESHSMDRSLSVGPGLHTVKVQWAVTNASTVFRLDDWTLTVERSQV